MKLHSKRTILVLVGVLAVAVFASVGAYAYWTTSGTGTGSASTGADAGVSVSQLGSISNLVPGGPASDIGLRVSNGASFNQYVANVGVVVDPLWSAQANSGKPACSASDFTISGSPMNVSSDLTPGNHDYSPSGVTIKLDDLGTNQDNCKSVSVPLKFAANAS